VGELGEVWQYSYWSDQKMRDIAADNAIDLDLRWRTALRTPSYGFLPQAEVSRERGALVRHEVATKVEAAVGQLAVADFVPPSPARYVKGRGEVTFSIYTGGPTEERKERAKAKRS
jgi:hypothetical protein